MPEQQADGPARSARSIAVAAGGAFAAFYTFYAAAPVIFDGLHPSSGVRVAVVMVVVVAVQPFVLLLGPWFRNRRLVVLATLVMMGVGTATLPLAGHWPGPVLLAAGFGVFVVTSTAWVKESARPGQLGKALGLYGFGSATGGAVGAPLGLLLAHHTGVSGVALTAVVFAAMALIPTAQVPSVPGPKNFAPQLEAVPATSRHPTKAGAKVVLAISAAGHLMSVTIYAAALSALGSLSNAQSIWVTVGSAFVIQASLSAGRLIGGALSDRWEPAFIGATALILLTISAAGFIVSSTPAVMAATAGLIGLGSGAAQTAALTAMMRRTTGPQSTERASTTWNVCFDIGLGLGALSAGVFLWH